MNIFCSNESIFLALDAIDNLSLAYSYFWINKIMYYTVNDRLPRLFYLFRNLDKLRINYQSYLIHNNRRIRTKIFICHNHSSQWHRNYFAFSVKTIHLQKYSRRNAYFQNRISILLSIFDHNNNNLKCFILQ